MKIALVHDWFNTQPRGAERVIIELAKLFPHAPIYTLLYNRTKFGDAIAPERIKTSWLQKVPSVLRTQPRYLLPFIPSAVKSWDLSNYDLIISSSSAFAKNLHHLKTSLHICYCHTPARFIWDYEDKYLQEQNVGQLQQNIGKRLQRSFKKWDKSETVGVDAFVANSNTVAKRIQKYYQRPSTVIYPPVDTPKFKPLAKEEVRPYYVTLAGLTPYKKIDLAIEACNLGGHRLLVIGDGPQRARLQKIAGKTIEFKGYLNDEERAGLLARAKGMIHPQTEDFGIAAVEAMAAGTPVVAFNGGGATETIINGRTGLLFDKQTPEGLSEALDKFEKMNFKTMDLVNQAMRFDSSIFKHKMSAYINEAYNNHVNSK